jgi:PAT family beta-lactamase induction signal transducer AmpG
MSTENERPASWAGLAWVPTLYFAECIPNAVVSDTAKFLYNDLGVSVQQLGVITGSMYLPWVLKPFWSPLVDLVKTKRWWIVFTQVLLAAVFLCLALSIQTPSWLVASAACLWVMAFISSTHDIACDGFYMLGLNEVEQARFTGIRATSFRLAMLFAKGFFVAFAGRLTMSMGKQAGWSTVLLIPAVLFIVLAVYHFMVLPRPSSDVPISYSDPDANQPEVGFTPSQSPQPARRVGFWEGYVGSFSSFFAKPGIVGAIAFMLLFRFAEAQLLAMVAPFLTGSKEAGGLALTTQNVGIAYGTYGVIGIILGGISAGMLVSYLGLRRTYWPLILIMHLPNLAFVYLASVQPDSLYFISLCLFLEQFGYGFGFTAYMLFLMYFARGAQKTSHYAICTGFMALSLMGPQMVSGYVKASLGFQGFFGYILACTIPSFLVSAWAWSNKEFIDYFPPAASK